MKSKTGLWIENCFTKTVRREGTGEFLSFFVSVARGTFDSSHYRYWNLAYQSSDSHIYFRFRFFLTLVSSPMPGQDFFWDALTQL